MTKLTEIWGINANHEKSLQEAGIDSVETLLRVCVRSKQRFLLAERTGISRTTILEWANNADLFRIEGVGSEYANLLREAGVETVPELSRRNAFRLHKRLNEIHESNTLDFPLPSEAEVSDWITQANGLPRILQY